MAFGVKKNTVWAEEVVQSVSFHLWNPCKQDPSPREVETGGSLGLTGPPAQLSLGAPDRFSESPCVIRRERMQKKRTHESQKSIES